MIRSSVGNEPHVLIDLRITRFKLSMAFMAYMIFRNAGSKAKNGITSCHARRQAGERVFPSPFVLESIEIGLGQIGGRGCLLTRKYLFLL